MKKLCNTPFILYAFAAFPFHGLLLHLNTKNVYTVVLRLLFLLTDKLFTFISDWRWRWYFDVLLWNSSLFKTGLTVHFGIQNLLSFICVYVDYLLDKIHFSCRSPQKYVVNCPEADLMVQLLWYILLWPLFCDAIVVRRSIKVLFCFAIHCTFQEYCKKHVHVQGFIP